MSFGQSKWEFPHLDVLAALVLSYGTGTGPVCISTLRFRGFIRPGCKKVGVGIEVDPVNKREGLANTYMVLADLSHLHVHHCWSHAEGVHHCTSVVL